MRRFLPFAALLGVALVLGCQDLGSGPVEPYGLEPQFAKKVKTCDPPDPHPSCPNEELPTYEVELGPGGDISGGPKESIPGVPEVENFKADLSFFKDNLLVTCGGEDSYQPP